MAGQDYSDTGDRTGRETVAGGLFCFCGVEQFGDRSELVSDLAHCIHTIGQQHDDTLEFIQPVEDLVEFLVDQFIVIQFDNAVHAGSAHWNREAFEALLSGKGNLRAGGLCASGRICVSRDIACSIIDCKNVRELLPIFLFRL